MTSRHYLDHASISPLRPEAAAAIIEFASTTLHGDPSRPYSEGRQASAAIEQARDSLATMLGVNEREVIFTSSGTEAANFANFAARRAEREQAPIVFSGVEHAAVRNSACQSGPVELLRVDNFGHVDLGHLEELLALRPALVNCQFANHEVGTLQPVHEVIRACRDAEVLVHVDACAAIGQLPVDLGELDADFVSLSAHKFGAPGGVGALVLRRGRRVVPLLLGGDQERARRAGMENALGIIALGAVADALAKPEVLEKAARAARAHSDKLWSAAQSVRGVVSFGDLEHRLPQLICLGVSGVEAEGIVLGLDQAAIAVHSGSACSGEAFEPSPVLQSMGVDAEHSLRISVGWSTTEEDVDAFTEQFARVVASLRSLSLPKN